MRKQPNILREPPSDYGGDAIVLYSDPDGTIKLDVRLVRETLWLSQKQMAELFDKDSDTIGLHIRNIYKESELGKAVTTEDFSVVQWEGSRSIRRRVKFYNLDMIISVGYRVNSKRGTQFRIWATGVLREHLTRESRDLAGKAKEIEDAVYDLKAVNPNKKPNVDTRTPEELMDIIEAKGKEVAAALATLRVNKNSV
ncbi:MAG: virulence RhuM family protein [Proteobacteria bacterium]|nr:virulence RhuM family protein [Pseudomonadota bacterium]MBU1569196.1 virulence RhuM family protein [Pseudomonadota bacterium]